MGQVLSTAFIEKFFTFSEPARKRRRRKARHKSFWKFLMNIFCPWGKTSKKPTSKNEKTRTDQATFCSDNHNHIVCEHAQDKFIGVMSFLAGKEKFKSVDVPGKKIKIKVTQDFFRMLLIIGVLFRFQQLHSEGKTLNGCFSADNICVPICKKAKDALVTPYIEVKLGYVQSDSFSSYTEEGGNEDLMKVGGILQHEILSSETELPEDLKQLLELLSTEPVKNQELIYGHVSLMGPRDQISHFLWLYKRLIFLKSKVPEKYNNIMQKIGSLEKDWRKKAKKSKFLLKLKPYNYSSDGKGLSRFYRNCVEHLFSLFKNDKANSTSTVEEEKEEELEDYHIIYILTEVFPTFLGDLQKEFHEEGELLAAFTTPESNFSFDI